MERPDERTNAGAVEKRHRRDVQHDVRFDGHELVNHPLQLVRLRTADDLSTARDDVDVTNAPPLQGYLHLRSFRASHA